MMSETMTEPIIIDLEKQEISIPTPSKLQKTFELIKPIANYLHGFSIIAIVGVVNTLTLNLELEPTEATNSILLKLPKGCGKTTLLFHILQKSNPEWFLKLPERCFESQIIDMHLDTFDRKVWVQDDLFTTFKGTSTKQREQLMGFHNTFLTKGEYSRNNKTVKGRIVCIYGLAKEIKKYQKEMFEGTFSDRFMPVKMNFDITAKEKILEARDANKSKHLPTVILPFRDEVVDVKIPERLNPEIHLLALQLDMKEIMSFARAQTFICNFLKANADLNDRTEVCEDDLRLFKLILPLHYGTFTRNVDTRVQMLILEKSMNGEAITGQEIKEEITTKMGCSESAVQKALSELKKQGIIQFQKTSLRRGYDYIYWI